MAHMLFANRSIFPLTPVGECDSNSKSADRSIRGAAFFSRIIRKADHRREVSIWVALGLPIASIAGSFKRLKEAGKKKNDEPT